MPTIHIMDPPDFRNSSQRAKFNEMVFRLENTNYSIGRVSTNLWVIFGRRIKNIFIFLNSYGNINHI